MITFIDFDIVVRILKIIWVSFTAEMLEVINYLAQFLQNSLREQGTGRWLY